MALSKSWGRLLNSRQSAPYSLSSNRTTSYEPGATARHRRGRDFAHPLVIAEGGSIPLHWIGSITLHWVAAYRCTGWQN